MVRVQVIVTMKGVEPELAHPIFKRVVDVECLDGERLAALIPSLRFLFSDDTVITFHISNY